MTYFEALDIPFQSQLKQRWQHTTGLLEVVIWSFATLAQQYWPLAGRYIWRHVDKDACKSEEKTVPLAGTMLVLT